MKNLFHTYETTDIATEAIGEAMAKVIYAYFNDNKKIHIALSGGSTPAVLFQYLAKNYKRLNWGLVHLYWVDERCVPADHSESNYRVTYENLIKLVDIPSKNIHRIRGENEPKLEAKRYAEEVLLNVQMRNGLPSFDIVLLGMGADGHVASIFPNQNTLINTEKIYAVSSHPETSQQRITMTAPLIKNAQKIFFFVTGKNKAAIIARVASRAKDAEQFPVYHVGATDGKTAWYLDADAASML